MQSSYGSNQNCFYHEIDSSDNPRSDNPRSDNPIRSTHFYLWFFILFQIYTSIRLLDLYLHHPNLLLHLLQILPKLKARHRRHRPQVFHHLPPKQAIRHQRRCVLLLSLHHQRKRSVFLNNVLECSTRTDFLFKLLKTQSFSNSAKWWGLAWVASFCLARIFLGRHSQKNMERLTLRCVWPSRYGCYLDCPI